MLKKVSGKFSPSDILVFVFAQSALFPLPFVVEFHFQEFACLVNTDNTYSCLDLVQRPTILGRPLRAGLDWKLFPPGGGVLGGGMYPTVASARQDRNHQDVRIVVNNVSKT